MLVEINLFPDSEDLFFQNEKANSKASLIWNTLTNECSEASLITIGTFYYGASESQGCIVLGILL